MFTTYHGREFLSGKGCVALMSDGTLARQEKDEEGERVDLIRRPYLRLDYDQESNLSNLRYSKDPQYHHELAKASIQGGEELLDDMMTGTCAYKKWFEEKSQAARITKIKLSEAHAIINGKLTAQQRADLHAKLLSLVNEKGKVA